MSTPPAGISDADWLSWPAGMHTHLIEELGGVHRPAIIPEQGFALAMELFLHILNIAAGAEAEEFATAP